ncbi:MAG TPA: type II CAAX endopeptidase family protein [Burkholderiales bacterium]|nr:type II CAAX endopeptidase family protein [Burkholderiales bacterium]
MNEKGDKTLPSPPSALSSPWLFFALVFCWTWFFWLSAAVLKTSIQTTLGGTLLLLGLLGPMAGGIGFTYLTQGKKGRREYWSRIVDLKRIPAKWYLVIFLFIPALMAIVVLLDVASGGNGTLVQVEKRVTPLLSAPLTIVPLALGVFVHGPIPEELGWRGYVLDRLQARWNALASSLILGAIWAVWHLPLFFIKDMIHHTQGVGSPWFWQFEVGVIPMAVILTWIFNNTRRSTLGAILFHFMANLTYQLANVTAGTNFYSTLLWIIAAIAVVALGAGVR